MQSRRMPGKSAQHQRPKNAKGNSSSAGGESFDAAKLMQDRVLHVLMSLIGKHVRVQTTDGVWFEGIFHTAQVGEEKFSVILKMAFNESARKGFVHPTENLLIKSQDFLQLVAKDVELLRDRVAADDRVLGKFATDSEISGSDALEARELVPWSDADSSQPLENCDLARSTRPGSWNQFETNKQFFGVESTYSDDLYTTKLDKSSELYRAKAAHAEKLAQEIENENREKARVGNFNRHALEDSGVEIDGDEEDLYSAVIRGPATSTANDSQASAPSHLPLSPHSPHSPQTTSQPPPTQGQHDTAHDTNENNEEGDDFDEHGSNSSSQKDSKPKLKLNPNAAEFTPSFASPSAVGTMGHMEMVEDYSPMGYVRPYYPQMPMPMMPMFNMTMRVPMQYGGMGMMPQGQYMPHQYQGQGGMYSSPMRPNFGMRPPYMMQQQE